MTEESSATHKIIIHPFVFAALPVVLLLSFAKSELLPEETIPALCVLEIIALSTFLTGWAIFRNKVKAALSASFITVAMFTYRVWQIFIEIYFPVAATQPWISLLSFFTLVALFLSLFLKDHWNFFSRTISIDFNRLNSVLNVVSSILLLLNLGPIALYEFGQQQEFAQEKSAWTVPSTKNIPENITDKNTLKPDIYYIVLDGFAAPSALYDFWQFDDPGFGKFLKARGFYVAERSLSNYDRTEFSICSSLNMAYINSIYERHKTEVSGLVFMRLIQDSAIMRILKNAGYRFVTVSSGSFGTDQILTADTVFRANYVNHFFRAVAYCTPWWSLESYFPLLRNCYCDTRLAAGTNMSKILDQASPKFVFIHTDLPHAPNLFDARGNRLKLPPGLDPDWNPPSAYFSQWQYCTEQTEHWLDKIMTATGGKAIIIVQSDHGSGIRMKNTRDWYNERMRIMNAYYLPGGDNELYPTITPVNSFRVILRKYFKADLPLLKDQSYCAPVWEKPFQWQEITKQINFALEHK